MSIESGSGYNPQENDQEIPAAPIESNSEAVETEVSKPAEAGRSWLENAKTASGDLLKSYFSLGPNTVESAICKTVGPALIAMGIYNEQGHYMQELAKYRPDLASMPNADTWHHAFSGSLTLMGVAALAVAMKGSWDMIKYNRDLKQRTEATSAPEVTNEQ